VPKSDLSFNPAEYALVSERIALFYERYPLGRIVTELVSRTEEEVTFRAAVYRASDDREPASTGWASERFGDGEINVVACLENTETSAIGRALANLGFTASRRRPSREEMEKAERARRTLARRLSTPPVPNEWRRTRRWTGAVHEPSLADAELQRRADEIMVVLRLLSRAEVLGMRRRRADTYRAIVSSGALAGTQLARVESRLRAWVERESRRVFGIGD
jgi:hypothetical protein